MPKKTMKKVRVAFVGAGAWASARHYPSLAQMRDVEIVAVADRLTEKAEATAKQFKIPGVFRDYREMLDETKPDAVYAIMPPHHIFDVAVDILRRKHHLFIEKPPGVTAYQTRQMAQHAKRNRVLAMAGFQRRYIPLVNTLKKKVETHGPIHSVQCTYVKYEPDPTAYYGGAIDILTCDAIHAVDTLRYLCGATASGRRKDAEIVNIASSIRAIGADAPNAFYALITFSNGVTGMLKANWACGHREFSAEMHTTGASAYAEPDVGGRLFTDGSTEAEQFTSAQCAKSDDPLHCLGFYAENRHFIDCIKKGKQPQSSLDDAAKSLELVERIYSAKMEAY
jgi:virulence factor